MEDFYKSYSKGPIPWDAFGSFVLSKHSHRIGSMIVPIKSIIDRHKTYTPTIAYEEVIKALIERDYLARIMQECTDVLEGRSSLESVYDLSQEALRDMGRFLDVESMFVTGGLSTVCDRITTTGYEWRLRFFNEALGPLRDGDFVIIAARVEVGKTTAVASEISYFLPQMPIGRPIIWVNNEERSEQVYFRINQAALNMTTDEILEDIAGAEAKYEKYAAGRKILVTDDKMVCHEKYLTSLFHDLNPGMIIFDQLDKVGGFNDDRNREDVRLGKLYKWARELAKQYGPVIAVSQLAAESERREWPNYVGLDSMRGSKTDKPAEADAIITIAKPPDPREGEEFQRSINIPKNKLVGKGPYHKEELRHGQCIVLIDPLRGRYIG